MLSYAVLLSTGVMMCLTALECRPTDAVQYTNASLGADNLLSN